MTDAPAEHPDPPGTAASRLPLATLTWDGTLDGLWQVLAQISDPEMPVISIVDLGIVRAIDLTNDGVVVTMTPTYAGCPATEVIKADIQQALRARGATATIRLQLAPAWTTEWITPAARDALRAYGMSPPCAVSADRGQTLQYRPACPRCGSHQTALLSAFGATPCKALYRCTACGEPFDFFKPL